MTTKTIEFYVAVNQDGDFYLDRDSAEDVVSGLEDEFTNAAIRTVKVAMTLDLPTPELVQVTVPAASQAPAVVAVS